MSAQGAWVSIHRRSSGRACLDAAGERARNTTIVIGVDATDGVLLIDVDVQADVCADAAELRDQLLLIVDALNGQQLGAGEGDVL